MAWTLSIAAEPAAGGGEHWHVTFLDDGGDAVARVSLPRVLLQFVNQIRLARPTPSTMEWTLALPPLRKIARRLLQPLSFSFLRDPATHTDDEE